MKPVIIIAIAFVLFIPISVFAQENSISVQTDKSHYFKGDYVVVSGDVGIVIGDKPVLIQIIHEGLIIEIAQITVAQNGSFTKTVLIEQPAWSNTGEYIIKAYYQDYVAENSFSVMGDGSYSASNIIVISGGSSGEYEIEYNVIAGKITAGFVDLEMNSIILQANLVRDGIVSIALPRDVIDAQLSGFDIDFVVFVDGIKVEFEETKNEKVRLLNIPVFRDTRDIEVIGTKLFL